jgi:transposase InsO family protein
LPSVNGIRYRELAGHEPPFSGSLNRDGDIRLPTESEKARGTGPPNILDRAFVASAPSQKWIAHFTYIWTAQGWLYVAAVVGAHPILTGQSA